MIDSSEWTGSKRNPWRAVWYRIYWDIANLPRRWFTCETCNGDGREMVYYGYGSCGDVECSECRGKGWSLTR